MFKEDDRKGFDEWYEAKKGTTFHFAEELKRYCMNDTVLLYEAVNSFVRICLILGAELNSCCDNELSLKSSTTLRVPPLERWRPEDVETYHRQKDTKKGSLGIDQKPAEDNLSSGEEWLLEEKDSKKTSTFKKGEATIGNTTSSRRYH
jgi:hypothetical protein